MRVIEVIRAIRAIKVIRLIRLIKFIRFIRVIRYLHCGACVVEANEALHLGLGAGNAVQAFLQQPILV